MVWDLSIYATNSLLVLGAGLIRLFKSCYLRDLALHPSVLRPVGPEECFKQKFEFSVKNDQTGSFFSKLKFSFEIKFSPPEKKSNFFWQRRHTVQFFHSCSFFLVIHLSLNLSISLHLIQFLPSFQNLCLSLSLSLSLSLIPFLKYYAILLSSSFLHESISISFFPSLFLLLILFWLTSYHSHTYQPKCKHAHAHALSLSHTHTHGRTHPIFLWSPFLSNVNFSTKFGLSKYEGLYLPHKSAFTFKHFLKSSLPGFEPVTVFTCNWPSKCDSDLKNA